MSTMSVMVGGPLDFAKPPFSDKWNADRRAEVSASPDSKAKTQLYSFLKVGEKLYADKKDAGADVWQMRRGLASTVAKSVAFSDGRYVKSAFSAIDEVKATRNAVEADLKTLEKSVAELTKNIKKSGTLAAAVPVPALKPHKWK